MRDAAFSSAIRGMKADVQRISSIRVAMKLAHGDSSADKRLDLLGSLFKAMDVENEGVVTMKGFTAQAKSALELEELKADFDSFDQVGGEQPDGKLTFRKFVAGTLETPLGRLSDNAFEKAVSGMITTVSSTASTQGKDAVPLD